VAALSQIGTNQQQQQLKMTESALTHLELIELKMGMLETVFF